MAVRSLLSLDDREFEHLVFDLLSLTGIRNLVWRTPGADGGRDLEGEVLLHDFAGGLLKQVWYIECKVRKASLSWPDVFEKLAYAKNHHADSLLICCSSTLSPKCKDEIAVHNAGGRRPVIRYWEMGDLMQRIERQPALAYKYRLAEEGEKHQKLAPLMAQALKAVQSATALLEERVTGTLPASLVLAQSIAEFCAQFTAEPFGTVSRGLSALSEELSSEVEIAPAAHEVFPFYAVKVAICCIALVARTWAIQLRPSTIAGEIEIVLKAGSVDLSKSRVLESTLTAVAVLSSLECSIGDSRVILRKRS